MPRDRRPHDGPDPLGVGGRGGRRDRTEAGGVSVYVMRRCEATDDGGSRCLFDAPHVGHHMSIEGSTWGSTPSLSDALDAVDAELAERQQALAELTAVRAALLRLGAQVQP